MMWKRSAMHCAAFAFVAVLSIPVVAADDGWQARA